MRGSMGSGQPLAIGLGQLLPYRAMASPRTAARPWLQPLQRLQPRLGLQGVAQDMQVCSYLNRPGNPQTFVHDALYLLEFASHDMLSQDRKMARNLDGIKGASAHINTRSRL